MHSVQYYAHTCKLIYINYLTYLPLKSKTVLSSHPLLPLGREHIHLGQVHLYAVQQAGSPACLHLPLNLRLLAREAAGRSTIAPQSSATRRLEERPKHGGTGAQPTGRRSICRVQRSHQRRTGAPLKQLREGVIGHGRLCGGANARGATAPAGLQQQKGVAVHLVQAGVAGRIRNAGPRVSALSSSSSCFLVPPGERDGALVSIVARGVGHPDVADVPYHEVGGEGVLWDEEDGTLCIHVQRDAGLPVGTIVHLQRGEVVCGIKERTTVHLLNVHVHTTKIHAHVQSTYAYMSVQCTVFR